MYTLDTPRVRSKRLERYVARLTHLHYTGQVATTVTVIRSRPNSYQVLLLEPPLVTLLHQLMGPHDQLEPVVLVEFVYYSSPEQPANSSTSQHPSIYLIWIRPNQVSESSRSGYFADSINIINFFNCVYIRRESSVQAKYLFWMRLDLRLTTAASGK